MNPFRADDQIMHSSGEKVDIFFDLANRLLIMLDESCSYGCVAAAIRLFIEP